MNDLLDNLNQLETYNSDDPLFLDKSIEVAKGICTDKLKIHDVVTNLQQLLVHVLPEKRAKGTLILSTILDNVQDDFLNTTELQFIATFYADRLKDHHQVIPAVLKGISSLTRKKNVDQLSVRLLLCALFDNVPCQQQQVTDRQTIYHILEEFAKNNPQAIGEMGLEFVMGVIGAMDGERDPRNLLLLFEWLPRLLPTLSLGHLAEEMFDVVSCYFPVDFRAPPQEAGPSVTREALAQALNHCMCASTTFAEFCVPLLLEKLNSALKIAKLDSLHLLAESCESFAPEIYETHSQEIWSCLQKELLNCHDPDVEQAGLRACTAVVQCMSRSQNEEIFKQTFGNMYDTLRGNLRPDTKLFLPTTKLLLSIAAGSKETCKQITQTTLPTLLNLYNLETRPANQEIIFKTIMSYVLLYIDKFAVEDILQVGFLSEVVVLCLQCVQHGEPSIRIAAFQNIALTINAWPSSARQPLYEILKTKLTTPESPDVRKEMLDCFKIISTLYSEEILENIISRGNEWTNNSETVQLYLEALCVLIPEPAFTAQALEQLLECCTRSDLTFSLVAFRCLRQLVQNNSQDDRLQRILFFDCDIVKRIIHWLLPIIGNGINKQDLLDDVSTILRLILAQRSNQDQLLVVTIHLNPLLTACELNGDAQNDVVIILEGLLSALRTDVEIPDKYNMLKKLFCLAVSMKQDVYVYVCRLAANILNKCVEDDANMDMLRETEAHISSVLRNDGDEKVLNILLLHCYITKALVVKGSTSADAWTDKLISLLDNHEFAAQGFKLVMDENSYCLTKDYHCNIRFLYRQKFFSYVTKKLNASYNADKSNYLLATGYLLQAASQPIVRMHFQEVFRLMILCLQLCKNADALCSVLDTLESLLVAKESYLESHVEDLLPHFLQLATFQSSMKVRISSMRCVECLTRSYATFRLLPLKQSVLLGLAPCLDDRKRLARRQAVLARSAWFLLDAPT